MLLIVGYGSGVVVFGGSSVSWLCIGCSVMCCNLVRCVVLFVFVSMMMGVLVSVVFVLLSVC